MALWCRCRYPAIFIGVQDRTLHGYTGVLALLVRVLQRLSSAPKDPIYILKVLVVCVSFSMAMLLRMGTGHPGRHVAVILHLAFVASCLLNIPNLPDIIVIFLLGWAGSSPMSLSPFFQAAQQQVTKRIFEMNTGSNEICQNMIKSLVGI